MSEKKKQRRSPQGSTRVELTEKLAFGLTTVDRLIAFGLESSGRRGRAKVYSLSAARRMARRLAPAELAAADVLIADYRSQAEDLSDRRLDLAEKWISDSEWLPSWRKFIAHIGSVVESWPERIGRRLGNATPREASLLGWADGPRHDPYNAAPEMEPFIRPLLGEFRNAIVSGPPTVALASAVAPPSRAPLPPAPKDVDKARAQWREARSAYRRAKVAVRRNHTRRNELNQSISLAISEFRAVWWSSRSQYAHLAGDALRAREIAERVRIQTLAQLAALGGLVPERPTPKTKRSRRKK